VTVDMADAGNLVPNSEVKVDDVTVGTVRAIALRDWQARLTVTLRDGVTLPSDAFAKIGQKSLLGAQYLELAKPAGSVASPLRDGSVIPAARSGTYPETEDVLASVSLLLNGGGLGQVQTITTELNAALSGREPQIRQAIGRVGTLVSELERQRGAITRAIDATDRFSGRLADGNATIQRAVQDLSPGLKVLADQRPELLDTVRGFADLSDTARQIVETDRDDLLRTLDGLEPTLRELAASGDSLPRALQLLTAPFPVDKVKDVMRGDAVNLHANFDLTAQAINRNFVTGTPVAGDLAGLLLGRPANPRPLGLPLLEPIGRSSPFPPLPGPLGGGR
jgi:phospholipid/cholesterol/gamma-HCH transport system substrate-binding protein